MQCPKCQHDNREGARFCLGCGQPLPVPPAAQSAACPKCGAAVRGGASFCSVCGQRMAPATPAAAPRQASAPAVPPPGAGAAPPPFIPARPRAGSQPAQPLPAAPPPLAPSLAPSLAPLPVPVIPPVQPPPARRTFRAPYALRHGAVLLLLLVGLGLVLAATYMKEKAEPAAAPPPPTIVVPPTPAPTPAPTADWRQAAIQLGYGGPAMHFGIMTTKGDPSTPGDDNKRLTYDPNGETNGARLWLDGETPVLGSRGGLTRLAHGPATMQDGRLIETWDYGDIAVEQEVSYVEGSSTGNVDTARIAYTLQNRGTASHNVGFMLHIDTLIGENDGVPFVVPGRSGLTDVAVDLKGDEVPDWIQALENPALTAPGVIVNLTLRGADATAPDRLVISPWCLVDPPWEYLPSYGGAGKELKRCTNEEVGDSAVGLYWNPAPLAAGETREIVTYYGLGGISSTRTQNAALSLIFNSTVTQDDRFWITALVSAPKDGQTATLTLPPGIELVEGYAAEQAVTGGGDYTQVSWQARAVSPVDAGEISVELAPDGIRELQQITVRPRGLTR